MKEKLRVRVKEQAEQEVARKQQLEAEAKVGSKAALEFWVKVRIMLGLRLGHAQGPHLVSGQLLEQGWVLELGLFLARV